MSALRAICLALAGCGDRAAPALEAEPTTSENLRDAGAHPTEDPSVGLRSDGRAVAAGHNRYGQARVETWRDLTAIAAGHLHTVGLRRDGTVVVTGRSSAAVEGWSEVVDVSAGSHHTVAVLADGHVRAVGDNNHGQCDVEGWDEIVAVAAGAAHTVGLRRDGTLIATGDGSDGRCAVDDWTDILVPA